MVSEKSPQPRIRLVSAYELCTSHVLKRTDWTVEKNQEIFGKCATLHGHQYRLEVILEGEIHSDTGMLLNGFEVDRIVTEKILSRMDHHHLNDDIPFFKTHLPTAEWIAFWIYEELKSAFPPSCSLKKIRIFETPNLAAEYPIKALTS